MARASRTSQARAARQAKMLYDMCAMAIVAGRADLDGADEVGFDIELPMFTVGRAGELANVHPQTLRQYDRLGLVVPRRQVERLRKPAGSSVFAADADGDIVEIERSRRARMWRRQIQVDARQLPSRESVEAARVAADAYDTRGGGVAGENEGIERGKPVAQPISRSIVLWGID